MSGKALPGVVTVPINRDDVFDTVTYVADCMGIWVGDLVTIGSTGKADISGDVDLIVDITKFDPEQIHNHMLGLLGHERCFFNKGTSIGSYAAPIAGITTNDLVQVDVMFVPNMEWAKFSFFSTGGIGTEHKGVIRNVLLQSVAGTLDVPGIDLTVYDDESQFPYIKIKRGMDINRGFRRIIQHNPKKKRGNAYTATPVSISMEDLMSTYPTIDFSNLMEYPTIFNPEDALQEMFGFPVKREEVNTAEQVVLLINKLPHDRKSVVRERCIKNLHETAKYTDIQIITLLGIV